MTSGIHLVHKPVGPTSFSVVKTCIQQSLAGSSSPGPKICHGGTLDPFASGLLLILVAPATRLFDYLHAIPKVYEATVRWGVETDNGDLLGQATFKGDPTGLGRQQLDDALASSVGWHDQTPPTTSAKRIDGERAYIKAHRGEEFVMPPSRVYLHEATWLGHDLPRESRLRVLVRGGYYVRALARDLGRLVGCGAHLTALHRGSIGPWNDPGLDRTTEIHGRDLLPWAATKLLSDEDIGDLRQGRDIIAGELVGPDWQVPIGFPDPQSPVRGFHRDRFCFLLTPHQGRLRVLSPLRGGL
jgi:tRNA pseudouridine55 synthase